MNNNFFECMKCQYQTNKKCHMLDHLNRMNKCKSNKIELFNYTEEEIYQLSLVRKKDREKKSNLKCNFCKKIYSTKYTLEKHQNKCKTKNLCIKNENIENQNNIENNIDNHIENNIETQNIQNNNIENQNINNNIFIVLHDKAPIPFEKEWTLDHIDKILKVILLVRPNKYTELLSQILENNKNLNVIIDKNNDDGYIFSEDNKYKSMNKEDVADKSIEKLYNHLFKIKSEIPSENNYVKNIINSEFLKIEKKYEEYKKSEENTKKNINECINNIFESKKNESIEIYKEIKEYLIDNEDNKYGF